MLDSSSSIVLGTCESPTPAAIMASSLADPTCGTYNLARHDRRFHTLQLIWILADDDFGIDVPGQTDRLGPTEHLSRFLEADRRARGFEIHGQFRHAGGNAQQYTKRQATRGVEQRPHSFQSHDVAEFVGIDHDGRHAARNNTAREFKWHDG